MGAGSETVGSLEFWSLARIVNTLKSAQVPLIPAQLDQLTCLPPLKIFGGLITI